MDILRSFLVGLMTFAVMVGAIYLAINHPYVRALLISGVLVFTAGCLLTAVGATIRIACEGFVMVYKERRRRRL